MSFDTIDLLDGDMFYVTWDLGKRCNYDCSYCPASRHDNVSSHASLDMLKSNVDFLYRYVSLYMQKRSNKDASVSFTGGEPTVNPSFIEFISHLRSVHRDRYADQFNCRFTLTSNGAMSAKMAESIIANMDHITISYHAEADPKIKQQVIDRIDQFAAKGFSMSINVMFHAEHFDECVGICDRLKAKGIRYVPRVIGEEPDSKPTFAHRYTEDQLRWMDTHWGKSKPTSSAGDNALGLTIGRPCCGARSMCLSSTAGSTTSKFVNNREFTGWYCSVNWFFMHIEQQTGMVYHHQTCQARFDNTRGPIGSLAESGKILAELERNMSANSMLTVVCTKKLCGCGLCSPKSKLADSYKAVMGRHIDISVLSADQAA